MRRLDIYLKHFMRLKRQSNIFIVSGYPMQSVPNEHSINFREILDANVKTAGGIYCGYHPTSQNIYPRRIDQHTEVNAKLGLLKMVQSNLKITHKINFEEDIRTLNIKIWTLSAVIHPQYDHILSDIKEKHSSGKFHRKSTKLREF